MGDHLDENVRHYLGAPLRQRKAAMKMDRWVPYPRAKEALSALEELMDAPVKIRTSHILIWGDTNNGKTSLLSHFSRCHLPDDNNEGEASDIPVVHIEMPEKPTARSIYIDILTQMAAEFSLGARNDDLRQQTIKLLTSCGVKMLVIDELHNAFSETRPAAYKDILQLIRYIGNRARIPIVCSGTGDAMNAMSGDPQCENRFEFFHLPHWENDKDFHRFLAQYLRFLPLAERSELAGTSLGIKAYDMTNGTVGEIIMLLQKSAIAALENGQEKIDEWALKNSGYKHPFIRRREAEAERTEMKVRRKLERERASKWNEGL